MAKVGAIPDTHHPYENVNAISGLYAALEAEHRIKPFDYIIQMGDARDMYSFSKFPRSYNLYTPKQEIEIATDKLTEFWKTIHKICPATKLIQIQGNHEERLPKRILERIPEAESLIDLKDLFRFAHVDTIFDGDLVIDDVIYFHGYLTKQYGHLRHFLRSCVFGHTHQAWILFEKIDALTIGRTPHKNGLLFEFSCGFLGDDKLLPLQYTVSKKNKWSTGYGIIEDGVPRFVPL